MFKVENSADGNCMYYAYGISLMYFLRSKNIKGKEDLFKRIRDKIFTKLELKEEQKNQLDILLNKDSFEKFSKNDIKTIIEPILGPATRSLAAKSTRLEFLEKPENTELFTSAKYGLEYYFKKSLQQIKSDLANLINNDFDNMDYTESEIYKVRRMKDAMEQFSNKMRNTIVEDFKKDWTIKEIEISKDKMPTKQDIRFYQENLLDSLIMKITIQFFTENQQQYLDEYIKHLNDDTVWGTEAMLMTLHRVVQGEHFVRNAKGDIDTVYDTEITLNIYNNGVKPSYSMKESDLIINNLDDFHWNSLIPDRICMPLLDKDYEFPATVQKDLSISFFAQTKKDSGKALNSAMTNITP